MFAERESGTLHNCWIDDNFAHYVHTNIIIIYATQVYYEAAKTLSIVGIQ